MSGPILAMVLNVMLIGQQPHPVEGIVAGGYHVGPFYAAVSVGTESVTQVPAISYLPTYVRWDFMVGVYGKGVDVRLVRYCRHAVFADHEDDTAGVGLVLRYSTYAGWSP
jgi:hypothetical protein